MKQEYVLGDAPGQPRVRAGSRGVDLVAGSQAIPELDEAVAATRPLWKHPAFIVSLIVTALSIAAMAALLIWSVVAGGGDTVSRADISVVDGNVRLTWDAEGPVDLAVVTRGEALDVSQLVVASGEAWVPAALGLYESTSCFVIRPSAASEEPVDLAPDVLSAQGGQSVCVRDAATG